MLFGVLNNIISNRIKIGEILLIHLQEIRRVCFNNIMYILIKFGFNLHKLW
jgi:hypothetical protein